MPKLHAKIYQVDENGAILNNEPAGTVYESIGSITKSIERIPTIFGVDSVSVVTRGIDISFFDTFAYNRPFMLEIQYVDAWDEVNANVVFYGAIDTSSVRWEARSASKLSMTAYSLDGYFKEAPDVNARDIFEAYLSHEFDTTINSRRGGWLLRLKDDAGLSTVLVEGAVVNISTTIGQGDYVTDIDYMFSVGASITTGTEDGVAYRQCNVFFNGDNAGWFSLNNNIWRPFEWTPVNPAFSPTQPLNVFFIPTAELGIPVEALEGSRIGFQGTSLTTTPADDWIYATIVRATEGHFAVGSNPAMYESVKIELSRSISYSDVAWQNQNAWIFPKIKIEAKTKCRVLGRLVYGKAGATGWNDNFDVDDLITGMLDYADPLGALLDQVTVNGSPAEISRFIEPDTALQEALSQIQKAAETMVRFVPAAGRNVSGAREFDVEIFTRKYMGQLTPAAINIPTTWSQNAVEYNIPFTVIIGHKPVNVPINAERSLGWYPTTNPSSGSVPKGSNIINIESPLSFPVSGGTFHKNGEDNYINDDRLAGVAKRYHDFYSQFYLQGTLFVHDFITDVVGKMVSESELTKSFLVTSQSIDYKKRTSSIDFLLTDTYTPATAVNPVAVINALGIFTGATATVTAQFYGGGSYDPNGENLSFAWTKNTVPVGTDSPILETTVQDGDVIRLTVTNESALSHFVEHTCVVVLDTSLGDDPIIATYNPPELYIEQDPDYAGPGFDPLTQIAFYVWVYKYSSYVGIEYRSENQGEKVLAETYQDFDDGGNPYFEVYEDTVVFDRPTGKNDKTVYIRGVDVVTLSKTGWSIFNVDHDDLPEVKATLYWNESTGLLEFTFIPDDDTLSIMWAASQSVLTGSTLDAYFDSDGTTINQGDTDWNDRRVEVGTYIDGSTIVYIRAFGKTSPTNSLDQNGKDTVITLTIHAIQVNITKQFVDGNGKPNLGFWCTAPTANVKLRHKHASNPTWSTISVSGAVFDTDVDTDLDAVKIKPGGSYDFEITPFVGVIDVSDAGPTVTTQITRDSNLKSNLVDLYIDSTGDVILNYLGSKDIYSIEWRIQKNGGTWSSYTVVENTATSPTDIVNIIDLTVGSGYVAGDVAKVEIIPYSDNGGSGGSGSAGETITISATRSDRDFSVDPLGSDELIRSQQRFFLRPQTSTETAIFYPVDYNTVAWKAFVIEFYDGTSWSVIADAVGFNMLTGSVYYVYYDDADDTVKNTTSLTVITGDPDHYLLAITQRNSDSANNAFVVDVTGNGFLTAARINAVNLAALSANMGNLTVDGLLNFAVGGEFRLGNGVTPGSGFTGWRIFKSGASTYQLIGVNNDVTQVLLDSDGKIRSGTSGSLFGNKGLFLEAAATKASPGDQEAVIWTADGEESGTVEAKIWTGHDGVQTDWLVLQAESIEINANGAGGVGNGELYLNASTIDLTGVGSILDTSGGSAVGKLLGHGAAYKYPIKLQINAGSVINIEAEETLKLVQSGDVTITHSENLGVHTITIDATGAGGGMTNFYIDTDDEAQQEVTNGQVINFGESSSIDVALGAGRDLTFTVKGLGIVNAMLANNTIDLANKADTSGAGASQYFGKNSGGTPGYYDLPSPGTAMRFYVSVNAETNAQVDQDDDVQFIDTTEIKWQSITGLDLKADIGSGSILPSKMNVSSASNGQFLGKSGGVAGYYTPTGLPQLLSKEGVTGSYLDILVAGVTGKYLGTDLAADKTYILKGEIVGVEAGTDKSAGFEFIIGIQVNPSNVQTVKHKSIRRLWGDDYDIELQFATVTGDVSIQGVNVGSTNTDFAGTFTTLEIAHHA